MLEARNLTSLFSLNSHSKQACDKSRLFYAISFFYATHLTFPEHVHRSISLQGSPGRLERKEAHPELDEPFHEAMILLDQVVEVLPLPQFTRIWQDPFRFQLLESFRISYVFINRDDARSANMRRSQRFREEGFSSFRIAPRAQEKFQGVSLRIHSSIEVHPDLFHFHIRFIDAPRVVRRVEMRAAALLQFGCVVLHPAIDGGVIDVQSSLEHHLLQIPVAQWIPEVPTDAQQNNLGLKVTPFERGGGIHEIGSSQFLESRRVYRILAIYA